MLKKYNVLIEKYGEENAGTWESVNESLEEAEVIEGKVGTPKFRKSGSTN